MNSLSYLILRIPASIAWLCVLFTLTASFPSVAKDSPVQKQTRRTFFFKEAGVRFNNDFLGARLNDCTQTGDSEFRILIRPENTPVNNSAWYAFQVVAKEPKIITVTLAYEGGKHRYKPKTSFDGVKWTPLETFTVDRAANEEH